jgi:DNA polymerase-1
MASKRLMIVDGYSLLFRAFYATRFMSTTDGRPTNALFGFLSMLFNLIERERPDCLLVALDAPGKTFRHTEYAEYKGTRREVPQELISQLPVARDLLEALGVRHLEATGYEADDIVGTVSRQAEENGYATTIVTGDLDALQLVDEHVTVVTPKQGVAEVAVYDPEAVRARFGFGPEHITDYKALVGDASDNIPGVPGVGEKTATKLILDYGPVEAIVARLAEIEDKHRRKIEPATEQLAKSKRLATIVRDAPVEFDFAPWTMPPGALDRARQMLQSLEFRGHLRRLEAVLGPYAPGTAQAPPVEVVTESIEVRDAGRARSLEELSAFAGEGPVAIFLAGESPQASMFDEPELEAFVARGTDVMRAPAHMARALFAAEPSKVIGHDVKPLYAGSGRLAAPRFDTMLAGYVLQSGRSSYLVRDLAQGYLDAGQLATPAQSAAAIWLLEGPMRARLEAEGQARVLDEIELPLVPVLAEMEERGIQVSERFLREFAKDLQVQIEAASARVYQLAGREFLIGSPKQLGEVLFDQMGIPGAKRTRTGYATGAEVLQPLAPAYPIVGEVLAWRELTKLKSTYADALPRMIRPDGRIHTSFNQTVAATGRLSSNEPNMQNIPIRTELGRRIRKAFVAADGFALASFDYSQIELRLLAHLCRDDALIEAFQKRMDVHAATAGLMFGTPAESVSKDQRRLAKTLNYAVLYGVTDFGLANQLGEGFGVQEARALIQQYFERFPKVKAFTVSVVEEARAKGFTTTLCGRRRYFPDIHAANRNERLYAERQAVNAPIQGSAADMAKLAMIRVRALLGRSATRLLLQVHDELVFELADGEEALAEPVRAGMEGALPLDVPVEVDAKTGPNWSEMTPV